jgi:hypothetical protein
MLPNAAAAEGEDGSRAGGDAEGSGHWSAGVVAKSALWGEKFDKTRKAHPRIVLEHHRDAPSTNKDKTSRNAEQNGSAIQEQAKMRTI